MAKYEKWVVIDSRSFCGNSVFFWASGSCGYTLDLRMAEIFTKDEAMRIAKERSNDKAIKYADVLKLVQHHVDVQDLETKDPVVWSTKRKWSHVYSHIDPTPSGGEEGSE